MWETLFYRSSIDYEYNVTKWTTPVVARPKACVWVHSLARVAGSNPAGAWIFDSCDCCMLSSTGIGLCVGFIARPEESYRVWCV